MAPYALPAGDALSFRHSRLQADDARWTVAGPLTLPEAIRIALANHPVIAEVRHQLDAADAEEDRAFAAFLPRISASAGYRQHLHDQRLVAARKPQDWESPFSKDILSAGVSVSANLFAGGRDWSEHEAARLTRAAAGHRLAWTQAEIVFEVTSVFYELLASERVLEHLSFSREALTEHERVVDELVAAGKAAPADRLRVEVRRAEVAEALTREQTRRATLGLALASLLGCDGAAAEGIEVCGELALQDPAPPPAGGLAEAFASRADYRAARADLAAQARAVEGARAGHWPTLVLQGSYGCKRPAKPPCIETSRPLRATAAAEAGPAG